MERRRAVRLAILFALACGAAPAPVAEEVPIAEERPEEEPPPFPREAALPAAPSVVVDLDMNAIRETVLWSRIEDAMSGDGAADVLGRRVLERTSHVRIGMYDQDRALVLVATGRLDGVLDDVVAELGRERAPTRVDRSGFAAYYIEDRMVAVQTSDGTIVLVDPAFTDEMLRTAAGHAPASPLPPEMRALLERPAFEGSSMRLVFQAREDGRGDPLGDLAADAGFAGIAGRIDEGMLAVTGVARASSAARAAQLAQRLEEFARLATADDIGSAALADGIRAATVRTDDRWVEVSFRFPPEEIEAFMRIVGPLSGL